MGSGLSSGLGSGSTRARDYSDLFYHRGASQGSARGWVNSGLDLRLNSTWLGLALARWVSAQFCLGSFRLVSDQFWPRFGRFRFGSRGMARLVSKLSSSWPETCFGEARGLVRLNSGIRPGRTRFEARYLAQLCSKLVSASRLGDRFGVWQLGLIRRLSSGLGAWLEARLGLGSGLGSRLWILLGFVRTRPGSGIRSMSTRLVLAEPRAQYWARSIGTV